MSSLVRSGEERHEERSGGGGGRRKGEEEAPAGERNHEHTPGEAVRRVN